MRRQSLFLLALLFAAAPSVKAQSCPGTGATLRADGGRLGDVYRIQVSGSPGAAGLLGIDTASGPTGTLFGAVCLGLSPALQLLPFTLDASGEFSVGGVAPPLAALSGLELSLQAGVTDVMAPGGVALSNGASLSLRSPLVFYAEYGVSATTGNVTAYDLLSRMEVWTASTPVDVWEIAYLPAVDRVAVLQWQGLLTILDAATGAITQQVQLPTGQGAALDVVPTPDGEHALVALPGTGIAKIDPLTGNFTVFSALGATKLFPVPDTDLVYAIAYNRVVGVDHVTGTSLVPHFPHPSGEAIRDAVLADDRLIAFFQGTLPAPWGCTDDAVWSLDVHTNLPNTPSLVPLAGFCGGSSLHFGPGSAGPGVWALRVGDGALVEIDPVSLALRGTAQAPSAPVAFMTASAGGSGWLLTRVGTTGPVLPHSPGEVMFLDAGTSTVTTAATLPGLALSTWAPGSDSLREAWVHTPTGVTVIPTDPIGTPAPLIGTPPPSHLTPLADDYRAAQ